MGSCSSNNKQKNRKYRYIYPTVYNTPITYIQRYDYTPITYIERYDSELTISLRSNISQFSDDDISCNFYYDDVYDGINTLIASVLVIISLALEHDYNICSICQINIATIKTTTCKHLILCNDCYDTFCKNEQSKCPICRENLNKSDPFTY